MQKENPCPTDPASSATASSSAARAAARTSYEFEHSWFVIGDHQYHPGYSLVLFKGHVRELHELTPAVSAALFQEVMAATNALVQTFHPWKMNHACYGNAEAHVHWHLFPRYDTLPDHRNNPWLHAAEFKGHGIDAQAAQELARRVRENLACANLASL